MAMTKKEQLIASFADPENPTTREQLQLDYLEKTGQANIPVTELDPMEAIVANDSTEDELPEEESPDPAPYPEGPTG